MSRSTCEGSRIQRINRARWRIGLALLVLSICFRVHSTSVETKKLNMFICMNEAKGDARDDLTVAGSLDGQWKYPFTKSYLETCIKSEYSVGATARVDHLRTDWRLFANGYGKDVTRWYPLLIVQTEGDHSLNNVNTLLGFGYRRQHPHGYLEFSGGFSKDVQHAGPWIGDIGMELAYEQKFCDHWKLKTGPKAGLGALGQIRLNEQAYRYSWDFALDYEINKEFGIGYHLWVGNTVPNSQRTQWLGVTYTRK